MRPGSGHVRALRMVFGFKPSPAVDMALEQAKSEEEQYTTESLFELDETQDEAPWKRVYARASQKDSENDQSG